MTDKLNLTTPTLDAVLHALIDPDRTDFEIRHLDLGRERSVWLAELRREIAGLSAREVCEDHDSCEDDDGSYMWSRCYACGHRLRFASDGCPQCGIHFKDGDDPPNWPELCECERCQKARSEAPK